MEINKQPKFENLKVRTEWMFEHAVATGFWSVTYMELRHEWILLIRDWIFNTVYALNGDYWTEMVSFWPNSADQ